MLTIFIHDLRVSALMLCAIGPLWAAGAVITWRHGGAFIWWNTAFVAALALLAPFIEWKSGTETFLHSLPVSRDDVVKGRYLGAAAATGAGAVLASAVAVGLATVLAWQGRAWPAWVAPEMLVAYVLLTSGVLAILLPCIFRFGLVVGSALAAGLVVAVAGTAELLWWPASGAAAAGASAASALVPTPGAGGVIVAWTAGAVGRLGLPSGALAALGGSAGLLAVSLVISRRVFRNREF